MKLSQYSSSNINYKNLIFYYSILNKNNWRLMLISHNNKLTNIYFLKSTKDINRVKANWAQKGRKPLVHNPVNLTPFIKEISDYFDGSLSEFKISIDPAGTKFQKSVWNELLKIPYGHTVSYSDIAATIKKPKACRAVALANKRNPVPIIIPCHRVIQKDGQIGGYAPGVKYKKMLLKLEKRAAFFK